MRTTAPGLVLSRSTPWSCVRTKLSPLVARGARRCSGKLKCCGMTVGSPQHRVTQDGIFSPHEPWGNLWQLQDCLARRWFLLVGRPVPTFSVGLQQKAGLSQPLGPAAHRPCLPHSSLRQPELRGQIPGAALEIYPPAAFSLKMLRLIFSREFREKLLWFFVYRLLLWDLLDILQGFQACTLGKYLFLVIWSKGWKPHHTLCAASPTGLKVQEIFSAINRH